MSKLDNITISHILHLQAASKANRLVVFVGAGVSASSGLPSWNDLIAKLSEGVPKVVSDSHDILKIAQMYRELRGDVEYLKDIKKILKHGHISCNKIHDAIMKLNPCQIITTNYDDLLEQAAIRNNKQYYVVAKDEHLPANQGEKMIVKMHGDIEIGNIVLTENDYFDYAKNFPLIRSFVLSLFSTKIVLFIGFSFNDINLKYLLREISRILGNNMQQHYLLSNDNVDALSYSYYLKKGIQLLCLPKETTLDLLKEQKASYSNYGLPNDKSIALNQSLNLINCYDPYHNDFIERAYNFFNTYDSQIRFLGQYISYMYPITTKKRNQIYISLNELILPKEDITWLNYITEKEDVVKDKYSDKLDYITNKLIDNGVISVKGCSYLTKVLKDSYEKNPHSQTITILQNLDFCKIKQRIEELQQCPLKFSIDDLELPYLLFKLGRYYKAYLIYKKLAPEMWKHRKYVSYFICLYNIKLLSGPVYYELVSNDELFHNHYNEENENPINLNDILKDLLLSMDKSIWDVLNKMVNGNMLTENFIKADEYNVDLLSQRKNAEKGGFSISSTIGNLLNNYCQSVDFAEQNYILNECHPRWRDTNSKMIEGILNSLMTPQNYKCQSKTKELTSYHVPLFIFYIRSDELAEKLYNLTNHKYISADKKFIDSLNLIINNLIAGIEHNQVLMKSRLVLNYLKNIILMLNATHNECMANIYCPIIYYWKYEIYSDFVDELIKLIKHQTPSAKDSIKLITCLLNSLNSKAIAINDYKERRRWEKYIYSLAKIAKEDGECIEDAIINQIIEVKDVRLVSSFISIVSEKFRYELIDYLGRNIDNLFDLCFIEEHTSAHIITSNLIERLKDSICNDNDKERRQEEKTCRILHQLSCNENYAELLPIIIEFAKTNKCYQFISAPLKYKPQKEVLGSWLMFISDDMLKELLCFKEIRSIALQFCDTEKEHSFKDRICKLMKDTSQ